MGTLMQRAGVGALVLCGLLAAQDTAQAQFSYRGRTFNPNYRSPFVYGMGSPTVYSYGLNLTNPYVAQQQYVRNLQLGSLAIASGQQLSAPQWARYVAPYQYGASPYYPAYYAPGASYAAPMPAAYGAYSYGNYPYGAYSYGGYPNSGYGSGGAYGGNIYGGGYLSGFAGYP